MTITALRFPALAILVGLMLLRPATAHTDSRVFAAQRYPFLPELTVNERPEVCRRLLEEVRKQYLTSEIEIDLIKADPITGPPLFLEYKTKPPGQWLGFETPAPQSMLVKVGNKSAAFSTIRWDLDANGEPETLVEFSTTLSGTFHYELHSIPRSLVQGTSDEAPVGYLPDQQLESQIRDAGTELIGTFAPFVLFSYRGEPLAHTPWSRFSISEPISVVKLTLEGRRKTVCSVSLLPHAGPEKNLTKARLSELPRLASFLEQGKVIMGGGGNCGTSRAGIRHHFEFWDAVWTRLYRPWTQLVAMTSREGRE